MIILGIETSCDETAASIIKDGRIILSHIVATSQDMHARTGGIIPENAAREQIKSIMPVIQEALANGCGWKMHNKTDIHKIPTDPRPQISRPPIDAIAVTSGPGLIGSLLVGVETAKTLSALWEKPIIPVNHLLAHIYANWLIPDKELATDTQKEPNLPAIALVVSGGHTDLVLLKSHGDIEKIGGTRDDAAGEAFDKTARLLGLPYPGGPAISEAAKKFEARNSKFETKLPRSLINEDNFDFSFSGLKTQVAREVAKYNDLKEFQNAFAHEVQEAITDVLVIKTLKAVEKYGVSTILLAGGVAANTRLREKFEFQISNLKFKIDFRVSPPWLCTDNASYIAACAEYNYRPRPFNEIEADPSLTITDRQ